jgi:transcriptional regulator PpsR
MSGVNFAQPDVTLVLDDEGVIRKATLSNSVSGEGVGAWLGRPWTETVGLGTGEVQQIVDDARESGISAFRQVLQRFPSGLELPMEYTTIRVGGAGGGLLAMGKNLKAVAELQARLVAAQQATEQEYWKLRDVETRYRLLFDASTEAVLMISAEDFRVVEANPAAVRSLHLAPGWDFLEALAAPEREVFLAMLRQVREQGRAPGIMMRLGPQREACTVRATLMASEPGLRYLLHITATGAPAVAAPPRAALSVDTLIDRLPDAFVALNDTGVVLRANRAFLDLIQVAAEGAVVGENLGRWLLEPSCDAAALLALLQRNRSVRLLPMAITGDLGTATRVEVSAAGNTEVHPAYYGVMLRDVSRRVPNPLDDHLAAVLDAVSRQVGHTPLLQVVRETSDAVERHYIKAALQQADGNRTAAAEILGLSRQSLHTKLNRYAADAGADGDPAFAG